MLFDQDYYLAINEARWAAVAGILDQLSPLDLRTAIDAGCGPGWFAEKLVERGLSVTGIDGRRELTEEAQRRVPQASFIVSDMEMAREIPGIVPADLCLCVGLLYHLENPFRVVRALAALTARIAIIESRLAPGDEPVLRYSVEGANVTQGLTYQALIPSRPALIKMLYASGFTEVLRYELPIDHDEFRETAADHRKREIFVASKGTGVSGLGLVSCVEPAIGKFSFARVP